MSPGRSTGRDQPSWRELQGWQDSLRSLQSLLGRMSICRVGSSWKGGANNHVPRCGPGFLARSWILCPPDLLQSVPPFRSILACRRVELWVWRSLGNPGLVGPEFLLRPARTFRTGNHACYYGISLFTMFWGGSRWPAPSRLGWGTQGLSGGVHECPLTRGALTPADLTPITGGWGGQVQHLNPPTDAGDKTPSPKANPGVAPKISPPVVPAMPPASPTRPLGSQGQ